MPLYQVENPFDKAASAMGESGRSFGLMTKNERQITKAAAPEKTVGGGISSAAGGAVAGASVGGPWGALIGAGVGLLAYYLS